MGSVLLSLVIPIVESPRARAQGSAFTYHGRLAERGAPGNGAYDLQFRLFDAVAGGVQQGDTLTLDDQPVSGGAFAGTLDFGSAVFDGRPRWLEVSVRTGSEQGMFTTLAPRQPITSTPYAIRAANFDGPIRAAQITGQIAGDNIAEGSVTGGKLAPGTITTAALSDGAVTAAKIATADAWNDWPLSRIIPSPVPVASGYFGAALAAFGDRRYVIGAPSNGDGVPFGGAAYLYRRPNTLVTVLTNPLPEAGEGFGAAVAAVGSTGILVGAPYRDDGATDAGKAYLFREDGTQQSTFSHPQPTTEATFGWSLAAVGSDRVLIAAPSAETGAGAGAVYLFASGGNLLRTFTGPNSRAGDYFGIAVAALGPDRVLVGAAGADGGGAAYLYSVDGALLATFANPFPANNSSFGGSIAALGTDRVIIGALGDSLGDNQAAGRAYLFGTNGARLAEFANPSPVSFSLFGIAVAAVGNDHVLIGTRAGSAATAYLFGADGTRVHTFSDPAGADRNYFGTALAAIGGTRILLGASRSDRGAADAGAAYLYDMNRFVPGLVAESVGMGGVTASSIDPGAVTAAALADGAVDGVKIAPGAVGAGHLAPGAVTTPALANSAVTGPKIALGAISATHLAPGAVGTAALADGAVTAAKIAPGAVITNGQSGVTLGGVFAGNGAGLAGLSAANIGSGTLSDTRLSANVALRAGGNSLSGNQTIDGNVTLLPSRLLSWGGGSSLADNQGGAIELGNSLGNGTVPFIDFHHGVGTNQDYNVRLINDADGWLSVQGNLRATSRVVVDQANQNNGGIGSNSLTFGSYYSGEGIASKRTPGGNRWGLDFYTASQNRLSIDVNGNVGIGTNAPQSALHVVGAVAAQSFSGNGVGLSNVSALSLSGRSPSDFWQLGGNSASSSQFLGTINSQALELRVNNARALRLEPTAAAPSLVGGYFQNQAGGVVGAAIAGGGASDANNAVVGDYGFIGAGMGGRAANQAVVGGGAYNSALGQYSSVGGGHANTNLAIFAFLGGGSNNTIQATSTLSVIGGGSRNRNASPGGFIGGGVNNTVGDFNSTISGGANNVADANASTIGGGSENLAVGDHSTVGGGQNNMSSGGIWGHATVAGGEANAAVDDFASVGGGVLNAATAYGATVAGGDANVSAGLRSFVGGGYANVVQGDLGSIAGGLQNRADARWSVVGGGSSNFIQAASEGSVIAGGIENVIQTNSLFAVIAGGDQNTIGASAGAATIGGGFVNIVEEDAGSSTISGGNGNAIRSGARYGTIAGGLENRIGPSVDEATIGGGTANQCLARWATVSGGVGNVCGGEFATVGGGGGNTAHGNSSTVGGGSGNVSSGVWATVPGGAQNAATAIFSFAAGFRAKANHPGSFVWADFQEADFASTTNNQFNIRAAGGVRLNTDTSLVFGSSGRSKLWPDQGGSIELGDSETPGVTPYIDFHYGAGSPQDFSVRIIADEPDSLLIHRSGSATPLARFNATGLAVNGTFVSSSDRNQKENFQPVDPGEVLAKVADLPLSKWNYKEDTHSTHLGPMAQDFHAAFGLGADDKHIATVDADGVALAAIQGLNRKLEEAVRQRDAQIEVLKRRLDRLEGLLTSRTAP